MGEEDGGGRGRESKVIDGNCTIGDNIKRVNKKRKHRIYNRII